MDTKTDFFPESDDRIVYVRPVDVVDLPDDIKAQAEAEGKDHIFAVHDADGQRLALVRDKHLAFILARQNDLSPVNVH